MKFCEYCGIEIDTKDGDNLCATCADDDGPRAPTDRAYAARAAMRRQHRRQQETVLRNLGLVKVRGALGGTYWE